jgi:hypothetical protein
MFQIKEGRAMVGTNQVNVGDWVSGTSQEDEKFIGYVEALYAEGGLRVRVTQSDHAEAVGRAVDSMTAKVAKLPVYVPVQKEELELLLDLALQTHDREWFDELTGRSAAASKEPGRELGHSWSPSYISRLSGGRLPKVN